MDGLFRCEVVPSPGDVFRLTIDGVERTAWHWGSSAPRPFFYPFLGPSGASLTRMNHPGAPNHDHHRSIWFAHHDVLGVDFWSEGKPPRIVQSKWLALEDADDAVRMAVQLHWIDGHDPRPLVEQELLATLRPGPEGESFLELDSTFRPLSEMLEFRQTNFGFLGIRLARSISAVFGAGGLTNSNRLQGERAIFGKPARWMDYSGPVPVGTGAQRLRVTEGVTCFDHPSNPGFPVSWHVRDDGWMGPSACRHGPILITRAEPLRLRYLLHAHAGAINPEKADALADAFANRPRYRVVRSKRPHRHYDIVPE